MNPATHRRRLCLALTLATIAAGILWRFAPLHLPFFLYKYGGSALWAIALYWLLAAILPRRSPLHLALLAATIAAALEFSRLDHHLDAFRLTLSGKLLLGRIFSLHNIAAYWLALAAVLFLDRLLLRHHPQPRIPNP